MAEENQRKASETEKQVDFGYRAVPESEKKKTSRKYSSRLPSATT